MPQFAANLSLMYTEHGFMDRFAAAAADGFCAVEYLFPYAYAAEAIASELLQHGLRQALFNAPPGDWDCGERGLACIPGRQAEFRSSIGLALDYAKVLGCPRIHVMAGLVPPAADIAQVHATYLANIAWAAEQAHRERREILIEPINTRDMPGYYLNWQAQAHAVLDHIAAPNLKVQMDLYHCQIMEGDLAAKLQQYLPGGRVAHVQIAGVPQRHEPDVGEVNYVYLLNLLDELGYEGLVGCEYRPGRGAARGATTAGLGWMQRWEVSA